MTETNQKGLIKKTQSSVSARPKSIKDYINSMQGEIQKALPSVMTPERFTRIALSAVSNTPKLAECTPQSFLGAMMNAAQLGLEPNTPLGHAYLIPYRSKNGMQCQFQIGYKGLLDLAHRAGTNANAYVVYENDEFSYTLGLHPDIKHIPAVTDRGKPIAYYATWENPEMKAYGFEVMTKDEVEAHGKKYSQSYNNSPWQTNFEEMAKKTVLKKALKYAPLKSEFVRAVAEDETVKEEVKEDMSEVPNQYFEAEYEVIDPDTGDVKEVADAVSN